MSSVGNCSRGYTLIEVLIAVTVFAVLAGSAYVALDGLSRAAMEHRERASAFGELQLALARLDGDLRQLISRPVRGPDGDREPALLGERAGLVATRAGWANPSGLSRSSLQRFAWQFHDGELVRTRWPVTDRVPTTRAQTESQLEGVRAFAFRYRDGQGRWRDQWPASAGAVDALPDAIEVSLESERFGRLRRVVVLE